MPENVDCRNFECFYNRKGTCRSERITLNPQGAIINQLTCVEAERDLEVGATEKRTENANAK